MKMSRKEIKEEDISKEMVKEIEEAEVDLEVLNSIFNIQIQSKGEEDKQEEPLKGKNSLFYQFST